IPNTVENAARAAGRLGVSFLTVHASGGEAMLRAAVKGVREGASERGHAPPRILAVTVLTSLSDADLSAIGYREGASESVRRLGALCQRAGVDGLVCSPREAKDLRDALGQALFLCTPGIRPAGSAAGDQARAETPAFAARAGADLLVVGRPIYAAADPLVAARALEAEVSAA
ncbi:MAG TPA: orotidine-5'-phosphate decarboxylase, partial [Myxococcaceae bacterium]|nr:orotidine-5'-phosphate decarboxylase [Myxococcaceae bacterium]